MANDVRVQWRVGKEAFLVNTSRALFVVPTPEGELELHAYFEASRPEDYAEMVAMIVRSAMDKGIWPQIADMVGHFEHRDSSDILYDPGHGPK